MTGPDGEMAVLQAAGHLIGHRGVAHPRTTLIVDITPETYGVEVFPKTVGHELTNVPAAGLDGQLVFFVSCGNQLLHILVDSLCRLWREYLLTEM